MTVPPPALAALKGHYRTGADVLATDFFGPCLNAASLYRRAVGYFSSMALLTWAEALPRLIGESSLEIQLIASPELGKDEIAVLRELTSETKRAQYRQMLVDRMLEEVIALTERPGDEKVRALLFAWLIANDRLKIRFAFPSHIDLAGIFHEKIGIFDFPGGAQVAFTGSANETWGGHRRNYESIDVYRSWIEGDLGRVAVKIEQFDEAWNSKAVGLDVFEASPDVVARLRARAPERPPKASPPSPTPQPSAEDRRWRHQTEALEAFIAARAGVLEMATGTGKTRTTMKILDRLIGDGAIDAAIVATDGKDLLYQWSAELIDWAGKSAAPWLIYRHFHTEKDGGEFALAPQQGVLVISREQLHQVLPRLTDAQKQRMIIVHDEVHGLGVPSLVASLAGEHPKFAWRLGLSATPDRAYDPVGNQFLDDEIGKTIFSFPLEEAIRRGVLSGFTYRPLDYDLTDGDKRRITAVYAKQAVRRREGSPMSKEEVWTEIAKVHKTAEMKPDVFRDFIQTDPSALKNTIIFVETKDYGNALLEDIHDHTTRYRTYYAEDDRNHLIAFARGDIDCLITCHRISQGIDIRALQNVILFASARAKLETIQRIGRCLRSDPNNPDKLARVIDFVRPPGPAGRFPNADQDRSQWLIGLSQIRRSPDA